jgi:hypothetical protein
MFHPPHTHHTQSAEHYGYKGEEHSAEFLPFGTVYQEAEKKAKK